MKFIGRRVKGNSESLRSTVDALVLESPPIHLEMGHPAKWTLGTETLMWLAERIPECARTIETGCGYSTIIFAAGGIEHTTITPDENEIHRIENYCESRGISTSKVNFVVGTSQRVLPSLNIGTTDLVLIDGEHAFPIPCLDWYFMSPSLRVGGLMMVDDWKIPSVHFLVDFMRAERPTWSEFDRVSNTIVFQKIAREDRSSDWEGQYINRHAGVPTFRRRVRLKIRKTARDLLG